MHHADAPALSPQQVVAVRHVDVHAIAHDTCQVCLGCVMHCVLYCCIRGHRASIFNVDEIQHKAAQRVSVKLHVRIPARNKYSAAESLTPTQCAAELGLPHCANLAFEKLLLSAACSH
jgi:hypothetical protein